MISAPGMMTMEKSVDSFPVSQAASLPRELAESQPSIPVQRKEVDYYLNPTELFRWINYRRWDGAKARVLSHPDECSIWIVSRHSSDGRILWRHLPLHLVCMQSETGSSDNSGLASRQIEALIDVLLDAYPDGACSPDDQGMLPLHLIVANASQPNDRILNQLLMAYPNGVEVKDRYGRTPIDILNEKAEMGSNKELALRTMSRAKLTAQKIIDSIREENANTIATVKQTASNERMASQRIIIRLEEELENNRRRLEELENRNKDGEGSSAMLIKQVEQLNDDLQGSKNAFQMMKRERDDLLDESECLRNQLDEHDNITKSLHHQFEGDRQNLSDTIAKLKSEVSTSKAMAEALESQLRSRFTNEEYLATTVSELETQIADSKTRFQQEKTKLLHERDIFENENVQLKRNVEELSKKSTSLQLKLAEVNKQMSNVLSSHGALNAEHDRMLESSIRTETELVEILRLEKEEMIACMKKQWEVFDASVRDQEKILDGFQQKEKEVLRFRKEEREKSLSVISTMRKDFHEARVSALERQRVLHQTDHLGRPLAVSSAESPVRHGLVVAGNDMTLEVESTSSSQTTRRIAGNVTSSEHSQRKSPSSSTYASKISRQIIQTNRPEVDSRAPSSSENSDGERRQGPATNDAAEGNLLHLLETRADQGGGRHWRQSSGTESVSYGTSVASSGQSSSFLNAVTIRQKPRMINLVESNRTGNFTDGSTTTTSSSPGNASISRTTISSAPVRSLPKHDDYSNNSSSSSSTGSIDESDADSSTRGGTSFARHKAKDSSRQYAAMSNGMRMGMIRISEEASQSDIESRFSHE